jgi:CBS domain-containing protein
LIARVAGAAAMVDTRIMVSPPLVPALQAELARFSPFAQMEPRLVEAFVRAAEQMYFAPGQKVLSPDDGVVQHLYCLRSGAISGRRGVAEVQGGIEYEPGALFPVGALMGERPVTATYHADEGSFCLRVPAAEVNRIAAASAPFADFLNRRVARFLEGSRHALRVAYSSQTLAEQALATPLHDLARRELVSVSPDTPLSQALATMHERHIGSMLVLDAAGAASGILTRHDILGRVTLPQLPLSEPISRVMTTPVITMEGTDTAQDAALLMSRHGFRHLPVTENGHVTGIVSERDVFAMQRLSLEQVSGAIRGARDQRTLEGVAQDIRRFARNLLAQGVGSRQLTELISHLNDVLTERLVHLIAADCGLDLKRACWLAFGSEGRSEQTIATDQDNGLVFASDDPARDRPAWLAFGSRVNDALDACGYPLCRGNVMASNPECCLTADEWAARFRNWMEHGAPKDLLAASIYFDFRPLAGRVDMAQPMRELVVRQAARLPRFVKQMADNALGNRSPLSWHGGIDGSQIDLKMQGTVIFVDGARLYALAGGIAQTNTRRRFQALAAAGKLGADEVEDCIGGFEFLQLLRLRTQIERNGGHGNPNLLEVESLNDIDRRVLKETLRVAKRLQQRMELDYQR